MLDWSQEHLAQRAKVGLSTVRDYENERRSGAAGSAISIRTALEDNGVVFLPSEGDFGPGVRVAAATPSVLRRPSKLDRWGALMISVEWRARELEVFLSKEALDQLGRFRGEHREAEYVALFDVHRERILRTAAAAIDAERVTPDHRVHLGSDDFSEHHE